MPAEQNKALILRYVEEVFNRGNLDVVDEFYASGYKQTALWPSPRIPSSVMITEGSQGIKEGIAMVRAALPDYTCAIEELTAEGDTAMLCVRSRGTHTGGAFFDIAPTGKTVEWTSFHIYRFNGGKVVEERWLWDRLGAFQQLGVLPGQDELNPKGRPVSATP